MTLGISNRYALWFSAVGLLILFMVLLATGFIIWRSSEDLKKKLREGSTRNFEAAQQTMMHNFAEYLRRELFTPVYELDIESITLSLKDLRRGMPITSVRIAEASGTVLTDGTWSNPSYGTQLELDRKRLESTPVLIDNVPGGHRVTFQIGSKEYISGYGEMVFSDEPLKAVIVRQDESVVRIWQRFVQGLFGIGITAALAIASLSLVASVILSRTLAAPLITLSEASRRIAQGELDHRVQVASHDELGELAASFNTMVDGVQKRTAEVARTTAALQAEIEERKVTEKALRESREHLALAQKAGRVGVFDWNIASRNVSTFGSLDELLGMPPGALGSYDEWARHVHPEDLPQLEAQLQRWIDERTTDIRYQYRFIGADRQTRWMAGMGQLMYKEDGTADRMVGTIVDITDLKERQRELETAKEAAESANMAKTEFLANMSHEMRTPLAGALGMIDLVLEMEIGTEERLLLSMAKRSAESLLRLISDLLDISRMEAGTMRFEAEHFRVRSVVETAVEVVSLQAREKGLRLSWTVAEEVPEYVSGDEGRLRQVLVNLLGNSVKFTGQGEIEVLVRPVREAEGAGGTFLLFSVRDTGIGIPTDQQQRIFGKFVQVDASFSRKYGGSGIGLALSRQIIERMGGEIWFESSPGVGSVFFFTLPVP